MPLSADHYLNSFLAAQRNMTELQKGNPITKGQPYTLDRADKLMLLVPPDLLTGVWRSCSEFSARLLHRPHCSPLNETWLLPWQEALSWNCLFFVVHKDRLILLVTYCAGGEQKLNHKQLHVMGKQPLCLLQSHTRRITWSLNASRAALQHPDAATTIADIKLLPCLNPSLQRLDLTLILLSLNSCNLRTATGCI